MSHEEIEVEALGVEVSSQPVELYKILKIANAVSGGGEAKIAITDGYVIVNGEVETRKRCKIYDGDVIAFNEEYYVLICDTPPTLTKPKPKKQKLDKKPSAKQLQKPTGKASVAKPAKTAKERSKPQTEKRAPNGRRHISF
ncbi:RNA-binding S4 domain-containing protein [Grimontia sp. NTOU-MAR1]|uniref:RNA-binding S4 domain-containing protein n=1 Tax=Grimontia sp. NTOU-MAR1 TaxID=3111011 RepID=UPI002DB819D4|nr:RNA-binding S4 domain-containing protein [Grimontia sp. NTOU-MAR1]WRV99947.1 RNA-binding S4 domain-containing protein [Grimontia sp. NTOU-MAR1]